MDAGKKTITEIFNKTRILEIPFFQRSYVWGEEQWERFLTDIVEVSKSNKPYFLGSVILKQQRRKTRASISDVRTIIDGQQRLTTLIILFKVLSLKNKTPEIFDFFKTINGEIALSHNHNDVDAFYRILELKEENELSGDDKITQTYNFFREHIKVEEVDYKRVLSNLMMVGIDLGIEEDEQQIFDTINSLGVSLTTAELLKNYFFSRDDLDSYNENWKEIFEKDPETKDFWDKKITAGRFRRENIDLFFYSFLQIKVQDDSLKVKTEDKNNFSKVERLFGSYKEFIEKHNIDKKQLIQEIKSYANIYRKNIDFDIIDRELTNEYGIERINTIIFGLENTTLIPFVLFVLKNQENNDTQKDIFGYLESYILRRIVCRTNNKNYNQLFSDRLIGHKILTAEDLKEYIDSLADKVNFMPSESDLKEGFHTSKLTNKQAAGILYMIESKIRNRDIQSTTLLGLNKYSLEHMMPKKWENNWGELKTEEERINRNKKLLTLGNLTIITSSLNSSIRDANWEIKKKGKKDNKGLVYYSAGIETLVKFLDEKEWNESTIEKRAKFLFGKAKDIWNV